MDPPSHDPLSISSYPSTMISCVKIKPHAIGNWLVEAQWALIHKFCATRGSCVWNCIIQAWQKLILKIKMREPINSDEVLTTSIWWSTHYISGNFGFLHQQATSLMHHGLYCISNLWNSTSGAFHPWPFLYDRFHLQPQDYRLI